MMPLESTCEVALLHSDDGPLPDVAARSTLTVPEPEARRSAIDCIENDGSGAAVASRRSSLSVRPIAASLSRHLQQLTVQYALEPYIPERGLVVLSGAPGAGKGKFVQVLQLCRAAGRPFLNTAVRPGPCLFWSAEQGRDEDDRVFAALGRGLASPRTTYRTTL